MAAPSPPTPAFELKSAALTLVAVVLKSADLDALARSLTARFADTPGAFDNDPVAIDLTPVRETAGELDFPALIRLLESHRMRPVAVRGGTPAQMEAALSAGLVEAQEDGPAASRSAESRAEVIPNSAKANEAKPEQKLEPKPEPVETQAAPRPALIVDKPLRSGQRVYAKGGDLVVMAVVSFGAEVAADGNVHVYAPLRGRALAGAMGDTTARIFTTCMEPQLLSIAGIYRTTETALPADVLGKPAQVRLDGEKLVIEALQSD